MLKRYFTTVLVMCFGMTTSVVGQDTVDAYTGIPPGFDFPADEAELEAIRASENVELQRKHVWNLWAGINQSTPNGGPVWETWFPKADTFSQVEDDGLESAPNRKFPKFEQPVQLKDLRQTGLEAVGQSSFSFVLFNKEGHDHVRTNKLYLRSTLDQLNADFPASTEPADRDIADFKAEAVTLKVVWQLVKKDGITPLPIWDFDANPNSVNANPESTWKRAVGVDPSRETIPPDEVQNNRHIVPVSAFYHVKLTQQQAQSIGGASAGDFMVLVGMHVTTKEIDDWVWATFWWHDRPDSGPFAMGRIDKVKDVWRNYLMDVAYDMDTPREFDGTPNACMNPWLEAGFMNGLQSNCMTCHQRSVWPRVDFRPITRGAMDPNDDFFKDKLQLDFLWSIGDNARDNP